MFQIGYLAAGIITAWIIWYAVACVRSDIIRTASRAIITALGVTPAIIAGHGVGILPAFLLLLDEKYIWWGVVPIVIVAIILLIVFFSVQKIRTSRIQHRISWRDVLIRPAGFKLFLAGLVIVLLKAEFRPVFHDYWILQTLLFVSIAGLHPVLCYAVQRDKPQATAWLPVWFVLPLAADYYPVAIIYYFFGLAGSFAGKRDNYHAYLTGLVGAGIACLKSSWQLYLAIRYADVQHVKIQAGIGGSAFIFILVATVFAFCLAGFLKQLRARRK